jgi:MinD-like ATPase involved in chromosome partitioning or flagellar assembly
MTAEALTRPVCTATIGDDDTVSVTIDGVDQTFGSMPEAIGFLASTAGDLRRPVKVTAFDPSSTTQPQTHLIVNEDGSVDADTSVPAKKRPPRRSTPRPAPTGTVTQTGTGTPRESPAGTAADTAEESSAVLGAPFAPDAAPADADAADAADAVATPNQHQPVEAPAEVHRAAPTVRNVAAPSSAPSSAPSPVSASRVSAAPHPTPQATPQAGSAAIQVEPGDERIQLRPEVKAEKAAAPAREGFRGWLNATFKANLAASPAEQASRERRARIQRPLETHCTMAVVQLKGGATKTTVAYHLAATYGRIRGGNILAGEFNENQGTLGERALAGSHDRTTLDLIRNLSTVTRRTSDLVRYIRPQGDDRIHVLASPPEGADRRRVDGTSVKAAHDVLLSLYNLILLDTGNSAQASTWRAAVDVADSLVFVAQNKADDFTLLAATIEGVKAQSHADKFARSILVITNTAQPNTERLAQLKEYGESIGLAAVIVVPFDRSLQEGQDFDYDALNPATRRAYEEATAALTDQL